MYFISCISFPGFFWLFFSHFFTFPLLTFSLSHPAPHPAWPHCLLLIYTYSPISANNLHYIEDTSTLKHIRMTTDCPPFCLSPQNARPAHRSPPLCYYRSTFLFHHFLFLFLFIFLFLYTRIRIHNPDYPFLLDTRTLFLGLFLCPFHLYMSMLHQMYPCSSLSRQTT